MNNKVDNISELKELGIYSEEELKEIASKMILNLRYEVMDFCGCGRPDEVSFMVRDILKAIDNKFNNFNKMSDKEVFDMFDKELKDILGFDSKNIVFEFILHVLNSADLLEHGSGVGGSWLTNYGEEILCAFDIVGDEILDI